MTRPTPTPHAVATPRETPLQRDLLAIYLNDHHGGAVGGLELAKRTFEENDDNEYAPVLEKLVVDLESDRQALLDVMEWLGFRVDPVKSAGGWIGEKLGRLKTNGRIVGYSPLSRVVEIEGLLAGSRARLSLFSTLHTLVGDRRGAGDFDLRGRADRAEDHLRELGDLRERACVEAFTA